MCPAHAAGCFGLAPAAIQGGEEVGEADEDTAGGLQVVEFPAQQGLGAEQGGGVETLVDIFTETTDNVSEPVVGEPSPDRYGRLLRYC